jgi:integrase
MKAERDAGIVLDGRNATLEEYLKTWLGDSIRPCVDPKTYEGYEVACRLHIVPALGHLRLRDLKPARIQAFYSAKSREGLSLRTRQNIHGTLKRALKQAMRWGEIAANPAELVDPPKGLDAKDSPESSEEIRALTNQEALRLFEAAKGTRLANLYVVAVRTGLRQGELLGLKWADLTLDVSPAVLMLRRSLAEKPGGGFYFTPTKRKSGRRKLALLPEAAEAFRRQQARQAEEKRTAGERWQENGLVFPSSIGTPMNRHNLFRRYFKPQLKNAGLPNIAFHDLRHTFATIMLFEWGASPRTVQEMMGHASIKITMDIYGHVMPNHQADEIRRLERLFYERRRFPTQLGE